MLIVKLWHYFKGYVIIKIEGFTLEKFLNLVVKEGIFIWDITRKSSTCIYGKVSKKDFINLKSIIKKVSCRLEIIDKKGLPFILWKMKKRKFLVAGASITLILIYFLTAFIWKIEIIGNNNISSKIILEQLYDLGLKEGEYKYKLSEQELEDQFLFNNTDISYINISFVGIKAKVEVAEKEKPPPLLNTNIPTNVIADREGIIHNVLVYGGEVVVKKGDLVEKGDLLISGKMQEYDIDENADNSDNKIENKQKMHAWGDIYAKTWYEYEIEVTSKELKNTKSDTIVEKGFMIGEREIILNKSNPPTDHYDLIEKTKPLIDIMGIKIPIYFKSIEYIEQENFKDLTEEEIKEQALNQTMKIIKKERKKEIEIKNSTIDIIDRHDDIAKVKVFIQAIENISQIQEISN